MMGTGIFNEPVGLLRRAKIIDYNDVTKTIRIQLNTSNAIKGNSSPIEIPVPVCMSFDNGLFIGGKPKKGSDIIVGQGSGNQYYYVSAISNNLLNVPNLKDDEIIIKASDNSNITLSKNEVKIGIDPFNASFNSIYNYSNNYYANQYSVSESGINISGLIKREKNYLTNNSDNLKLKDSIYYLQRSSIGLDPNINPNNLSETFNKNPPLVENRNITYEYQGSSNVLDDFSESLFYKNQKSETNYSYPDRRKLRSNTLNLSLNNPNVLIEKIEGTVVDIFGNILDINRYPIKFGKTSFSEDLNNDKTSTFFKIKEFQRKGLAYHFELNAKKDVTEVPDVNDNTNYSKNRSRFFFDIDKEGQFKINIPASSEKGNVSLLTRYENYSYISTEDNNNPNKLIFREDKLDILHDSFNIGQVSVNDENGEITPIDRITNQHIKYGTAYHNIVNTCIAHQSLDFINFQNDETITLNDTYIFKDFISKELYVSGPSANAGGRSGSISLDGSIDLNIGANTSDRQSIILDTAGGILGSIGRDKNNNSAVLNLDGNFIVQIGGTGINSDTRFSDLQNGFIAGTLDIRVMRPGLQATVFRIDQEGLKILTAGRMFFHANSDIVLKSDSTMTIEAENLIVNERLVQKGTGGSI